MVVKLDLVHAECGHRLRVVWFLGTIKKKRYSWVLSAVSFLYHICIIPANAQIKYVNINAFLYRGGQVFGYQILPVSKSPRLSKHRECQPEYYTHKLLPYEYNIFPIGMESKRVTKLSLLNILQFLTTEPEVETLVSCVRRSFHPRRGDGQT